MAIFDMKAQQMDSIIGSVLNTTPKLKHLIYIKKAHLARFTIRARAGTRQSKAASNSISKATRTVSLIENALLKPF